MYCIVHIISTETSESCRPWPCQIPTSSQKRLIRGQDTAHMYVSQAKTVSVDSVGKCRAAPCWSGVPGCLPSRQNSHLCQALRASLSGLSWASSVSAAASEVQVGSLAESRRGQRRELNSPVPWKTGGTVARTIKFYAWRGGFFFWQMTFLICHHW